jgi:hypothetical protein
MLSPLSATYILTKFIYLNQKKKWLCQKSKWSLFEKIRRLRTVSPRRYGLIVRSPSDGSFAHHPFLLTQFPILWCERSENKIGGKLSFSSYSILSFASAYSS